jgi:outer membrane receptor protein involved in Fe transport
MTRHFIRAMSAGLVLCTSAGAQSTTTPLQLASREPAFYAIVGTRIERAEARNVAVLRERLVLRLNNATIPEALMAIEEQTSLRFAFQPSSLPGGATVSLDARDITVAAALTQVLLDADVDVQITAYGLASIVPRHGNETRAPEPAAGTISGRVTDALGGQPMRFASVALDGTRTIATNDSGTYRFANVAVGTHTVSVRVVGYSFIERTTPVGSGESVTVDFKLVKTASQLDQVVVTGTLIPTEVKALPTPITVITDSMIAAQQPHSVTELFRQFVPTGVSFDNPDTPYSTFLSVRGASDLQSTGTVKMFIDGVEVAGPGESPVDLSSIDRIEVIRGPEAAAIYGSGAIDGVVNIFTKRGDASSTRPEVDLQAAGADVQTPYPGFRGILRQNYSASLRGGAPDASYNVGGSYSHTDNYQPEHENSAQSAPSAYGGLHYAKGVATLDLSARYLVNYDPPVENPLLFTSPGQAPSFSSESYTNQTVGAKVGIAPVSWWRNTFSVGYDQWTTDAAQRRARLTSPSDTELSVFDESFNKVSLAYNTSVTGQLTRFMTGSLTMGADHWSEPFLELSSGGVLNTTGAIVTDTAAPFSVSRTNTWNTGVFAQGQLGLYDALFLTVGLRAEWNSDWGDSIGVPISPRFGASYAFRVGPASLKLRASWGSALLPPGPTDKEAYVSTYSIVLANPHLGPTHQKGGDGGFDIAFGSHGLLSATYYNQTALNLVQEVALPSDSIATYQNENVGKVRNTGIELEGTLNVSPVSLHLVYGHAASRVESLAPGYQGDLRVGEQAHDIPFNTGGASLSFSPWSGTSVSAGLTYVGNWTDYNFLGEFRCLAQLGIGQTTGCPAAFLQTFSGRPWLMHYPSLIKGNLRINQRITSVLSAFVSIDNIGDNENYEGNNAGPVFGRITTLGLHLHY